MSIIKEEKVKKSVIATSNEVFRRRAGMISVAVISLIYSFWGYFQLVRTDRSLFEMIVSGGLSVIVALLIDSMLRLQGILDGGKDQQLVDAESRHMSKVTEAQDYLLYADEWTESETKKALKDARTYILASEGLRYKDFFDEKEDNFLDVEIEKPKDDAPKYIQQRYKDKLAAISKAIKFKVTPLTITQLTSKEKVNLDSNDTGRQPSEYVAQKTKLVGLAKVSGFFIFGLVGFQLIQDPSWANFFYGVFQVALYLIFGLISYYLAYSFMITEYRNGLEKKIGFLQKLISYGKDKEREKINTLAHVTYTQEVSEDATND